MLRNGIRTGMLNSVLFPKNVIENAPQIFSNLSAAFPPLEGHFIVGPAVKIGWGAPTPIIVIELGIALEFAPAPQRLLIMGRLIASLPKPENPNSAPSDGFPGIIDFVDGTISLDATIYDSRIAAFTLSGDMALRAGWAHTPSSCCRSAGTTRNTGRHPISPRCDGSPFRWRPATIPACGWNPIWP